MAGSLVDSGVRNLILIGRSGVADPQAREAVDALRARGAQVLADAVDVTSRTALADLLAKAEAELPPLRGILHGAMVLDDALLADQDGQRFTRVVAPKLLGAWNLYELTSHLDLDAFVLFSSATSMVGNPGQANYAAANAFLDHFAEALRARGQRVLALNWGRSPMSATWRATPASPARSPRAACAISRHARRSRR